MCIEFVSMSLFEEKFYKQLGKIQHAMCKSFKDEAFTQRQILFLMQNLFEWKIIFITVYFVFSKQHHGVNCALNHESIILNFEQ